MPHPTANPSYLRDTPLATPDTLSLALPLKVVVALMYRAGVFSEPLGVELSIVVLSGVAGVAKLFPALLATMTCT